MSDTTTDQLVDSLQDWWIGLTLEEKRKIWELYENTKVKEYQKQTLDFVKESLRRHRVSV